MTPNLCCFTIWKIFSWFVRTKTLDFKRRKDKQTWSVSLRFVLSLLLSKMYFLFPLMRCNLPHPHFDISKRIPLYCDAYYVKKIPENLFNGELSHLISSVSITTTKEAISFEFVAFNNGKECAALTDSLRVACCPNDDECTHSIVHCFEILNSAISRTTIAGIKKEHRPEQMTHRKKKRNSLIVVFDWLKL